MCHLAKEWGATDFDSMLERAAQGGHRELCYLAKKWGATNFRRMIVETAFAGHQELRRLARAWEATRDVGICLDFNPITEECELDLG